MESCLLGGESEGEVKVKIAQSCPTLCKPMDYTVHWILQARILEWVAFLSPGDLPNPGIEPRSPVLQADSLPAEPQGKPKNIGVGSLFLLQGIFPSRDRTQASCIVGGFFTNWAIRESQSLSFFFLIYFNWRLITLQYCGSFCHTFTWISHGCTFVPHLENPSHLSLHPIPQGHPSAPALSTLSHASNLDWRAVSHMVIYMFQCYSLKSSHPHLLPQSPKVCSLHLMSKSVYVCLSVCVCV